MVDFQKLRDIIGVDVGISNTFMKVVGDYGARLIDIHGEYLYKRGKGYIQKIDLAIMEAVAIYRGDDDSNFKSHDIGNDGYLYIGDSIVGSFRTRKIDISTMTQVDEYVAEEDENPRFVICSGDYVYCARWGDGLEHLLKIQMSDMSKVGKWQAPSGYNTCYIMFPATDYIYMQFGYTDYQLVKIRVSDMTKIGEF